MASVSLLGDDLIMASQVQAVARDSGSSFQLVKKGQMPAADFVFVDLNWGTEALDVVRRVRAAYPAATIVGFCGHEAKHERQEAMAAGANLCVTNGSLAATARRLLAGDTVTPHG